MARREELVSDERRSNRCVIPQPLLPGYPMIKHTYMVGTHTCSFFSHILSPKFPTQYNAIKPYTTSKASTF